MDSNLGDDLKPQDEISTQKLGASNYENKSASSISLISSLSQKTGKSIGRRSINLSFREYRAKKIHIYRNGDRYFAGIVYAFSIEKIKTLGALQGDLTRILSDKVNLPIGVRYIFTLNGKEKIISLDQIHEGESYVCSSFDNFVYFNYDKNANPDWCINIKCNDNLPCKSDWAISEAKKNFDLKEYIYPKIINVFKNGPKPRFAVKMILNKKTAHAFEQILNEMTQKIKLNSGSVRSIYTIKGKQLKCLKDFFTDETVFIAYGIEKPYPTDFEITDEEYKFLGIPYPYSKGKIDVKNPTAASSKADSKASSRCSSPTRQPMDFNLNPPKSPHCKQRKQFNSSRNKNKLPIPGSILLKYSIGKILGTGNFAVVCECNDKLSDQHFALKIIDKNKCKGKEDLVANEVSILRKIKHPNIIQLIEDFDIGLEIYLVMELVNGGDLFDAISSSTKYSERSASLMMHDLAEALFYLHSVKIAHRDVKPENILVVNDEKGVSSLKLGDFGLAVEITEPLYIVCGSPTYVAPEIISETGYGVKVDVWASGIIAYILLCGYPPFSSSTNSKEKLFCKILSGNFEFSKPYWDNVSELARDFIRNLLKVDQNARFSAQQMRSHKWLDALAIPEIDLQPCVIRKLNKHVDKEPKIEKTGESKSNLQRDAKCFGTTPMEGDNKNI